MKKPVSAGASRRRPPRRIIVGLLEQAGVEVINNKKEEATEVLELAVRRGPAQIVPRRGNP
ncbi:MAG: hypothetical protein UT32_C0007G0019 [Parcubacteria group bacterium GW2011_GWC2_39_14]|nr:MAG: hypothetical protein UT32_C0007G0019 [Parcubacteria group bacterium GW2011_GWC2_39_14]